MSVSSSGSPSPKKQQQNIRIGFDMDGVILDNPARIFRRFIATGKQWHLLPRRELEFYQPKNWLEKRLWLYLHKSSWRLAPGYQRLRKLQEKFPVLEAYVISARFDCLQPDSQRWLQRFAKDQTFQELYLNSKDEQPHLFKARLIKQLKLNYYVEDNLDLARYLSQHCPQTEIWWLSNWVDGQKSYPKSFRSFSEVIHDLEILLKQKETHAE